MALIGTIAINMKVLTKPLRQGLGEASKAIGGFRFLLDVRALGRRQPSSGLTRAHGNAI